jgi:hypothetical protein
MSSFRMHILLGSGISRRDFGLRCSVHTSWVSLVTSHRGHDGTDTDIWSTARRITDPEKRAIK